MINLVVKCNVQIQTVFINVRKNTWKKKILEQDTTEGTSLWYKQWFAKKDLKKLVSLLPHIIHEYAWFPIGNYFNTNETVFDLTTSPNPHLIIRVCSKKSLTLKILTSQCITSKNSHTHKHFKNNAAKSGRFSKYV